MKVGQCFSFKFTENFVKSYFFTGEFDNEGRMIMCEMLPKEEIDLTSFWRMSKIYFDDKVKEGIIKLINTGEQGLLNSK